MSDKINVSERAVIQRINRRLKPDFQMLRKARGHTVQSMGMKRRETQARTRKRIEFQALRWRGKGLTCVEAEILLGLHHQACAAASCSPLDATRTVTAIGRSRGFQGKIL